MSIALDSSQGPLTLEAEVVTIGQASDNRIVIDDNNVSPYHAELRQGKRGYSLVDLGRKGGTYVNERRIEKQTPYRLNNGDVIRIGDTVYNFKATWTLETASESVDHFSLPNVTTKRGRFGQPRTVFSIYGSILLIALAICVISGLIAFSTLPNPTRTLTAYCNALKRGDYGTAFKQLDETTQQTFNVIAFTQYSEDNEGAGTVKDCLVANVQASSNSASGTIRYTFANKSNHAIGYALSYIGSSWFITNASISTPKTTLTDYCNALLKQDFKTAFNLVSNDVRTMETEAQFATRTQAFLQAGGGNVTSCAVSNIINSGSSATGTLTFTSASKKTAVIDFELSLESGAWRLVSEQPRPYGAGPTPDPNASGNGSDD